MDYRTLHAKTVADLRLLAKQNHVKIPAGANKMHIVELILEKERANAEIAAASNEETTITESSAPIQENIEQINESAPTAQENISENKLQETENNDAAFKASDERKAEEIQEAPVRRRPGRPRKHPIAPERTEKEPAAAAKKTVRKPKLQLESAKEAPTAPEITPEPLETSQASIEEETKEAAARQNSEEAQAAPDQAEETRAEADDSASAQSEEEKPEEKPAAKPEAEQPEAQQAAKHFQYGGFVRRPYQQADNGSQQERWQRVSPRAQNPAQNSLQKPMRDAREYRGIRQQNRMEPSGGAQSAHNAAENADVNRAFRSAENAQNGERAYRRTPSQPYQQPEAYPKKELYGESGMGTSNATVAEMLQNNECQDGAGVLDMHAEGYGFLRAENYLPGANDVYVSIAQIRRFGLRNGDYVVGKTRPQREGDRYGGLLFINTVNGETPDQLFKRRRFEDLTPIYPNSRIRLENEQGENDLALRSIDLIAPIGKGQRGLIVSPPKAGKTVLLKKIANSITQSHPEIHLIVLLIDERPEEVTDLKRSINGEVVYSTFDEMPENHTRLSEMALDRAERLVEMGKDVVILMDSITRLARAYNLVIPPTGRSLSGGLDPGALHKPKRFFGAARNIENGGSLTIIATALIETGSRMDDIIYEEFKGTGNMELHLDRTLSERRIFPAIDLNRSGTRREELLLDEQEAECALSIRRMLSSSSNQDTTEQLISLMDKTRTNNEFISRMKGWVKLWQKEGYNLNT